MARYLFRIDDVCERIDFVKFSRCLELFQSHGVKPILGIIPDNRDEMFRRYPAAAGFWETIREAWQRREITIALHGLHHVYHSSRRSMLYPYGVGPLTEFAGLPFEEQAAKIAKGIELLEARGLKPELWMAPNHSFDRTTMRALAENNLRNVTDGVGLYPFVKAGLRFFPALSGKPRRVPLGITTIGLHPNTMDEGDFLGLERFLDSHRRFISFDEALAATAPFFAPLANLVVRMAFLVIKSVKRARAGFSTAVRRRKAGSG